MHARECEFNQYACCIHPICSLSLSVFSIRVRVVWVLVQWLAVLQEVSLDSEVNSSPYYSLVYSVKVLVYYHSMSIVYCISLCV